MERIHRRRDNPFWDPTKGVNPTVPEFYNVLQVTGEMCDAVDITIYKDVTVGGTNVRVNKDDYVYMIDNQLTEVWGTVNAIRIVRSAGMNKVILDIIVDKSNLKNGNDGYKENQLISIFSDDIRFVSVINHDTTQTMVDIYCDIPVEFLEHMGEDKTGRIVIIGNNILGNDYTFTAGLSAINRHDKDFTKFSVPKALPDGIYKLTMIIENDNYTATEYIGNILVDARYGIFVPYCEYSLDGLVPYCRITGIDYKTYYNIDRYTSNLATNTNMVAYYNDNIIVNIHGDNGIHLIPTISFSNEYYDLKFPIHMMPNTCIELFNVPGNANVILNPGALTTSGVPRDESIAKIGPLAETFYNDIMHGIRFKSMKQKNVTVFFDKFIDEYICDHPYHKNKDNDTGFSITVSQTKRNNVEINRDTYHGTELKEIFNANLKYDVDIDEHIYYKKPYINIPNIKEGDEYIIRFNHFEHDSSNIIDYFEYIFKVSFDPYGDNPSSLNYVNHITPDQTKRYFVYNFGYSYGVHNLGWSAINLYDLLWSGDSIALPNTVHPSKIQIDTEVLSFDNEFYTDTIILTPGHHSIAALFTYEDKIFIYRYPFNITNEGLHDITIGKDWIPVDPDKKPANPVPTYDRTVLTLILNPDEAGKAKVAKYDRFESFIVAKLKKFDNTEIQSCKFLSKWHTDTMQCLNQVQFDITKYLHDDPSLAVLPITISGYIYLPDHDLFFNMEDELRILGAYIDQMHDSLTNTDGLRVNYVDNTRYVYMDIQVPLVKE